MEDSTLHPALDLEAISVASESLPAVRKQDLAPGDWVQVTTKNSVYVIGCQQDGRLTVSGGWFDAVGCSPAAVLVSGCSFGGRALHTELLAAPGLFLEFGNRVTTTRIQEVRHFKSEQDLLVS